MEKVTVLMPCYNRADTFLPKAMASVLNQTYKNFELVILDDASPDNSGEVVKRFQEEDKRIKYKRFDSAHGNSHFGLNWGVDNSKNELIAICDDDNFWMDTHLERLVDKINEGYDLAYCYHVAVYLKDISEDGFYDGRMIGQPFDLNKYIYFSAYNNYIDGSDILFKKKAYQSVGGMKVDKGFQDYALVAKMGIMGYKIGYVPEALTHYNIHDNNSCWMKNKDVISAFVQHMDIF